MDMKLSDRELTGKSKRTVSVGLGSHRPGAGSGSAVHELDNLRQVPPHLCALSHFGTKGERVNLTELMPGHKCDHLRDAPTYGWLLSPCHIGEFREVKFPSGSLTPKMGAPFLAMPFSG